MNLVDVRLALLQTGYVPIPARGKVPHINGWSTKVATNAVEIEVQAKQYFDHLNTGILTKTTPAVDIDITFLPAAEAVEALAREEFEERGSFLLRIGKAPKRAFLLRTDEPFEKLTAAFTAPDGSEHKIEILGTGQQVIVDGIHPDTGKPYSWHGGTPLSVPRDDLPYVLREDAISFLGKASKLLVEEFRFQPIGGKTKGNGADREDGHHERADWAELVGNIIAGRDLHDSLTRLAASYVASGMDTANAARAIKALFLTRDTPRDERWKARFNEIGRAVRSAHEKFGKGDGGGSGTAAETSPGFGMESIMSTKFAPIAWVVPTILVEGVSLLAAKPKAGKSWMMLHAAHAVSTGGFTLGELHCPEGDVLYCALEDNYRRIKSRMIKMFGHDVKGSPRLTVFCEFPKLAEGGIDRIKEWIGKATQPRMIVIDTLSMVRVSMKRNDTQFQADYDAVKDLRTLAAEHHVAIVLVHHLRKADADDPFDTVNATLGLTAAVDSILIIKREASGNFTLHGRGRDLSGLEKALAFNPANCTWSVLGEAREVTQSSDRAAIVAALEETGEEMTLAGITAATGIKGVKLRLLLARMAKVGEVGKAARGRYRAPEPRA